MPFEINDLTILDLSGPNAKLRGVSIGKEEC
jgi:hypothetical protein